MTIEALEKENGYINHDGTKYVLINQAYISGPLEAPYYTAYAIVPAENLNEDGLYNVYELTWNPLKEWLAGDREDEGDACDWDSPDEVAETMSGYDIDNDCII